MFDAIKTLEKLRKFCAYQDRCKADARKKLSDLGIAEKYHSGIIKKLQDEGFIDEQRFAAIFARGKFNGRKWGKIKIKMALKQKEIHEDTIKNALNEIDKEAYTTTLKNLAEEKWQKLQKEKNLFTKKGKVAQFLIQKGFEGDLVWDVLRELEKMEK